MVVVGWCWRNINMYIVLYYNKHESSTLPVGTVWLLEGGRRHRKAALYLQESNAGKSSYLIRPAKRQHKENTSNYAAIHVY